MFNNAKFASTLAFGVAPHAIGKDHPEGVIAGVHSNYYFTFPAGNRWPANKTFVEKYFKRWNEYPNFQSDGAYHTLYMYKTAIEKANKQVGGWPDEEAIIGQLEGMYFETAAGYLYIRPDNHQGYHDAVTGFSKNVDEYPFQILDPNRMITIPIRNITAPPNLACPELRPDTRPLMWKTPEGSREKSMDRISAPGSTLTAVACSGSVVPG
jgi:branched-chain amino acid transport system substrate-binding protein